MTQRLAILICIGAMIGCGQEEAANDQRQDLAREQTQAQADLAVHQAQERTRLEQELVAQQAHDRAQAEQHLADQTQELHERQQATEEQAHEVDTLIAQACTTVAASNQDICPIERGRATARDIDRGVALRLEPNSGTSQDIQHRMDCYRARAAVRAQPAPNASACLFDLPDTSTRIVDRDGHVDVELTSTHDDRVAVLRHDAQVYRGRAQTN